MPLLNRDEFLDHQLDKHFYVQAWLEPGSPLTTILEIVFDYPPFDHAPNGVGGLSGRIAHRLPLDAHEYDKKWHQIWHCCDEVNDAVELGSVPGYDNVTLYPAIWRASRRATDIAAGTVCIEKLVAHIESNSIDKQAYFFDDRRDNLDEAGTSQLDEFCKELQLKLNYVRW